MVKVAAASYHSNWRSTPTSKLALLIACWPCLVLVVAGCARLCRYKPRTRPAESPELLLLAHTALLLLLLFFCAGFSLPSLLCCSIVLLWLLLAHQPTYQPPGNGSSTSLATTSGPRQLQQAIRPLPAEPVHRPTPDTLNNRFSTILKHFPSAMGVDDFIARTEVALCYFGFTGDNTIGEAVLLLSVEEGWRRDIGVN